LPAPARPAFLEACAKEIAAMPELGDGVLHRVIVRVQKAFFDPPDLDGRMDPTWRPKGRYSPRRSRELH
jgi:hypothetical protein